MQKNKLGRVSVTIASLQQMKRDGRKIVGAVVYDYQMARIVDHAGVDIVSVGDSVGVNMWAHREERELTLEQMVLVCNAVRCGVSNALVSCDVPIAVDDPVEAARTLARRGGAQMVKIEAGPDVIRAIIDAGVPVWAQLGSDPAIMTVDVAERRAKLLEDAGASLLDFRHSGPVVGHAVAQAVSIPVLGGLGGGPWLDGRVRAVVNAIGYTAAALDDTADRYANVARVALDAITSYAADVRGGRQVRGK